MTDSRAGAKKLAESARPTQLPVAGDLPRPGSAFSSTTFVDVVLHLYHAAHLRALWGVVVHVL